jgi:hypothetical protein
LEEKAVANSDRCKAGGKANGREKIPGTDHKGVRNIFVQYLWFYQKKFEALMDYTRQALSRCDSSDRDKPVLHIHTRLCVVRPVPILGECHYSFAPDL